MAVGMGRHPHTSRELFRHGIRPGLPGERKPKPLLGQIERTDPRPERGDHFLGKMNRQRFGTPPQHTSLKQGRNPSDVIHMAVRDQYGIDLLNESSTITEQMDTRFACIDEQVSFPGMNDATGKKTIRRGNP